MFKIFRKNCCGLDVHKTWIYACIGITDTNSLTEYKQARFSSFSKGLKELSDWLLNTLVHKFVWNPLANIGSQSLTFLKTGIFFYKRIFILTFFDLMSIIFISKNIDVRCQDGKLFRIYKSI